MLSRKTLSSLEEASKIFNAPRDALVEYSVERLLPVIEEERERHRKRRAILNEITEYMKQGERILKKSEELLGENDPVYDKFSSVMKLCSHAYGSIESFVRKGSIIEDF